MLYAVPISLSSEAFRKDFWMMHWGAECPKRTVCWSSDAAIIMQLVPASNDLISTSGHLINIYIYMCFQFGMPSTLLAVWIGISHAFHASI